ncbi:regulator of sirC expression with transglutaminase-like and TPR domain [Pseudomonas duriflava]|uniref:Regulator of sirC expression with transglutaminase-like and TPR domain n=1 Tax=Pseudomonas duriflava TaxID=459528 RepID=A0A562QNW5_9PSED|nr:transglutaminase family protein [Pseudomonas duriflava]TWI58424.1 regulator of sirC expression with transglutaminase-like and TPR domain [Pseudomonas duriflava]
MELPRQACLDCLRREPPAVFEAALWIAAEHDLTFQPETAQRLLADLIPSIRAAVNERSSPVEQAQQLLRQLVELGFHADEWPLKPHAALLHQVLVRRRGQPLSLALIALELAFRLDIPLSGINFPGHFLLRVPGADHLLDPTSGRRLYSPDCKMLLAHQFGPQVELNASHFRVALPYELLQRLSRNLRQLHHHDGQLLAALKDAQRVLELGPPMVSDHLARADLYGQLDCPQAQRYDIERALLLSNDPNEQLELTQRLAELGGLTRLLH